MKLTQVFWLADYFFYLWRSNSRHGTHSPFVYQFADQILYQKSEPIDIDILELWRSETMNFQLEKRKFHDLNPIFPQKKYLTLLFRQLNNIQVGSTFIEIGHSFWSIPRVIESAKKDIQYFHYSDITFSNEVSYSESYESNLAELHKQNSTQQLWDFLTGRPKIDFVFVNAMIIDLEPLISIQLIDKIIDLLSDQGTIYLYGIDNNWNQKNLWDQMIRHPRVTAHIDLFRMGILFVRPEQRKEKFILRY